MSSQPRIPARPTTYKGVQMRSRLEAGFAQWLDKHDVVWEYEPQAFAGEAGQYLPDFRLDQINVMGNVATVYAEIKPYLDIEVWIDLTNRMPIIWQSEPEATLVLVVEHNTSWRPAATGDPHLLTKSPFGPGGPRLDFVAADWCCTRRTDDQSETVGISGWVDSPWPPGYWEGRG